MELSIDLGRTGKVKKQIRAPSRQLVHDRDSQKIYTGRVVDSGP
jgi:hypothetical protein